MDWTTWILASAVMLAIYDLLKKASVRDNAVLPVLAIGTAAGAFAYAIALSFFGDLRSALHPDGCVVFLAFSKAVLVGTSWILTYCALRTLPITIATPIRSSSPALVVLFAIFIYGESPTWLQWIGITSVFFGFMVFSWAGKAEGVDFFHSKAVFFAVGGMILSATSALYDKYVFQVSRSPVEQTQFWYEIGLFGFYAVIIAIRRLFGVVGDKFEWRRTIPFVGICLAFADWLFFTGLSLPDVPISLCSLFRRFSVVITFFLGALLFHEHNMRRKLPALILVMAGVAILCLK